ncbi:MAG: OmpA family protein, partial [Candidatus Cloacimonetes bacterium]|nr:OmpA family protein [Candidatus Cloacimonadota bacterium]
SGQADNEWIVETEKISRFISGISRVDFSDLQNIDVERIFNLCEFSKYESISFERNQTEINQIYEEQLLRISENIKQAIEIADKISYKIVFLIEGFTDNTGDAEINKIISRKRAENVRNFLFKDGVKSEYLEIIAREDSIPNQNHIVKTKKREFRIVTFSVFLNGKNLTKEELP